MLTRAPEGVKFSFLLLLSNTRKNKLFENGVQKSSAQAVKPPGVSQQKVWSSPILPIFKLGISSSVWYFLKVKIHNHSAQSLRGTAVVL